MVCESCGEKKKKTCDNNFPKAVVEITNPDTLVLLRKVTVPASMGDEKSNPPKVGAYCNVLLYYEATGMAYLYSSDGIPTLLTISVEELQDLIEQVADLEEEVDSKQDKLTAGDNITIEDNVISAVAATYVAGDNIQINGNVISATDTIYDDTEVKSDITNLQNAVQDIEEKIPSAASSANQLADKNFVNSSIATNTANFIGTFDSVAELEAYSGPLTNNDYAFVVVTDAVGNTAYDRYKYNGNTSEWLFEYELNNSSFTADQWAAINSGITSGDVTKLGNLADIQTIGANLTLTNGELSATDTTYTAGTNVQISNQNVISATDTTYTAGTGLDLNGTEFSVDTTVIAEKTDIPTVNNATLTITQNGTSAGTFTANSATDTTIALTDTTYSNYTGATSLADGTAGLVPAPLAGDETKFLSGNGQWTTVSQYSLPIASANDLGGIKVGNNLTINSTTGVLDATDTTYSNFTGTDGQTAGVAGLVPAPATTDAGKYLKADGTWDTVSAGHTYTAGDGIDISAQDVISATNTGKAKTLTTDDYNWPTSNPNRIALWLLDEGTYIVPYGGALSIDYGAGIGINSEIGAMFLVAPTNSTAGTKKVFAISGISNYYSPYLLSYTSVATGSGISRSIPAIVDTLTSTSTTSALSANQGKTLKDLIDSLVIKAAGAPTTATVGTVGMLYEDTTNGKLYQCTAIDTTDPQNPVYTWTEVGAGGSEIIELTSADYNYPTDNPTSLALWLLDEGTYVVNGDGSAVSVKMNSGRTDLVTSGLYEISNFTESGQARKQLEGFYNDNGTLMARLEQVAGNGTYLLGVNLAAPTIAQSTGTSTTSVMSQNAVTSMVFADPSLKRSVRIGDGAGTSGSAADAIGWNSSATGNKAVALGTATTASADGAIALGANSSATQQGEVAIGTSQTSMGYNSSNYRLLTGLYDPQSDHDAANKEYVDGKILTNAGAPTTSTAGTVGQLLQDSTNGKLYICTDATNPYVWEEVGSGGASVNVFTTNEWNALWS